MGYLEKLQPVPKETLEKNGTEKTLEFVGKLSKLCHKYGVVIVADKNYPKPLLVESKSKRFSKSKLTYVFEQFEPLSYEQTPKQLGMLDHIYMKFLTEEESEKLLKKEKLSIPTSD